MGFSPCSVCTDRSSPGRWNGAESKFVLCQKLTGPTHTRVCSHTHTHTTRLHREINPRGLSLSLLHSDSAVAADKHYLVCDHVHSVIPDSLPPSLLPSLRLPFPFKISQSGASCVDTVGCHTVSSVGVSVASVAVTSQKTWGNVSLLTSSVCLAARLIAGVCSAEEEYGAQSGLRANPWLHAPNKHPSLCQAFPGIRSNSTKNRQWKPHVSRLPNLNWPSPFLFDVFHLY